MKLKELGEFGLIDRIKSGVTAPDGMTGIGDDCAVIPQGNGIDLLVSTDMLVEGIHFILDDIKPYRLGWKSAAVNPQRHRRDGRPSCRHLPVLRPARKPRQQMDRRVFQGLQRHFRQISLHAARRRHHRLVRQGLHKRDHTRQMRVRQGSPAQRGQGRATRYASPAISATRAPASRSYSRERGAILTRRP